MSGLSVIFKAVDEISSKFDAMVSSGTKALDAFDQIGDSADRAFSSVEEGSQRAADAMDRATEATDYWTDAIGNYDKGAMQAVWTTEELVDMGYMTDDALTQAADAMEDATRAIDDVGNAADRAARGMEYLGEEAEEAGQKSSESMMSLDDVLQTVGIVVALKAIAGAFMECSNAAAEFETSVAMVSTVADTTVLSADELSAQISELSAETGKGVNDLAAATYNAISAGVATENAVSTVGEASKLATAGFTSETSALSVLTTALNAYQLEASEVTNISDSLVTAQNLGVLTIDQMASSMGKAISTASAYSVDLYNLESAYVSLTKAGISVEESTTYVSSMMNELGSSSSVVAKILSEETSMSFGQLMDQGYTLADVLGILYDSVNQDSEALMNLWGSAEAGKASNAIINQGLETFNTNLDKLANSAGTTQLAYDAMTETTAHGTQRMENSFANLSIAIGEDLNPVVGAFQNGIADVMDKFTGLITKSPIITAVFTGLITSIGILTLGLGGYTIATKVATLATSAWTAVMNMNPVFLAVTAVTALTAGIAALVAVMGESESEYDTWTYATKRQYDELRELNDEYERACDMYGETSEEALRLKYQVDDLSESFEENKQTMEDFLSECDSVIESCQQMADEYEENMRTLHTNEIGTLALIQKLDDLANSTDNTAGKQMQMEAIIAELNGTVYGLNLSYGDLINNQEAAVSSLREYAEAQARQEKMQAQYEAYVQSISKEAEAQEQLAAVKDELAAAQEAYNTAEEKYLDYLAQVTKYDTTGFAGLGASWGPYGKAVEDAEENVDALKKREAELNAVLEEQQNIQSECEKTWEELANATAEATAASDGYAEAKGVLEEYSEQIRQLCEDYDVAYQSALNSIKGQYSLWDEANEIVAMSKESIEQALQSQTDYWNAYYVNLETLSNRAENIEGLSDMLAELSDGSEESAAMLDGLAKLNDADLTAIAKQYMELQEAQSNTATSTAEMQTDFEDSMEAMQEKMAETVDAMNLSDEAKENAKSTMDAYVKEIEYGVMRAQSAIDGLSFANTTLGFGGYHAYAEGTLDAAPGLALVGEDGPELVNFGGGEVVYTAPETADILSRSSVGSDFYVAPPEAADENGNAGDKTVTLRIEGAGEMKVGGSGVSKDEVVGVLMDNIKGVLMNILQAEILEEGDLAYEF